MLLVNLKAFSYRRLRTYERYWLKEVKNKKKLAKHILTKACVGIPLVVSFNVMSPS
jgi:hypothetical protein